MSACPGPRPHVADGAGGTPPELIRVEGHPPLGAGCAGQVGERRHRPGLVVGRVEVVQHCYQELYGEPVPDASGAVAAHVVRDDHFVDTLREQVTDYQFDDVFFVFSPC